MAGGFALLLAASLFAGAGEEACVSEQTRAGIDACRELAQRFAADPERMVALALRLEGAGRPHRSLAVLEVAVSHYPQRRDLLQALIRLRATSRAAVAVTGRANEPAVAAVAPIVTSSQPATTVGPESLAEKLELLDEMRETSVISQSEYRDRRTRLIDAALSLPAPGHHSRGAVPARPDPARFGAYRALIIGNARYRHLQDLRTPQRDAQVIGEVLRTHYGFQVQTLVDVDRDDLAGALSDLRRSVTADDNVLIYFAGHGYLDEVTKRGYWLPVDAEPDRTTHWLSTADVIDTLAALPAKRAMVIADSCFSGALLRGSQARGGATLSRLMQKRSRTVLTSGGLEPVQDGGRGVARTRHSVFAAALLDALRNNTRVLDGGSLFLLLRDRVALNADQTPEYGPIRNAGHEGGDFFFVRR